MKSQTLKAKLEELNITGSHSRPRVSNDNPFVESLFRTLKYVPGWLSAGFTGLDETRRWVERFSRWYTKRIGIVASVMSHRNSATRDKIQVCWQTEKRYMKREESQTGSMVKAMSSMAA